jgi:hypothetical protein
LVHQISVDEKGTNWLVVALVNNADLDVFHYVTYYIFSSFLIRLSFFEALLGADDSSEYYNTNFLTF